MTGSEGMLLKQFLQCHSEKVRQVRTSEESHSFSPGIAD
jgi:hypothetical protein